MGWETWRVKKFRGSSRSRGLRKLLLGSIIVWHGSKVGVDLKIGTGPNLNVGLRFGMGPKFGVVQISARVPNLTWF